MTQYTPVLIKFIPGVLIEDESAQKLQIDPIRLVIKPPQSQLLAATQSLAIPQSVTVPFNNELRLKLLPSNSYNPKGRYRVAVHQGKNRTPLYQMVWIVPDPPRTIRVEVINAGVIDELNLAAFEVLSVSHTAGTYKLEGGQIIWLSNPPALGSSYQVTYQPAVTLDQLITTDL